MQSRLKITFGSHGPSVCIRQAIQQKEAAIKVEPSTPAEAVREEAKKTCSELELTHGVPGPMSPQRESSAAGTAGVGRGCR